MSERNFTWRMFFSYGFRPFFLFGCLYAALAMAAWMAWIGLHAADGQVLRPTIAMAPHEWHAHEMLFGYTLAMIAGFFLTAVPNWTGAKPVCGGVLAVLTAAWLAGRAAIWFSADLPPLFVALVDLAFIPMLLALVAKVLFRRWAPRNFVFVPILTLLFIANLLIHGEWAAWSAWFDDTAQSAYRLALDAVILLVTIIGGRVVPAFTTNALRRAGHERLPASRKPLEILSVVSVAAVVVADVVAPFEMPGAIVAAVAALANGLRLAGWRGLQTLGEPIIWVLHLAYAWLVIGLGLKAAAHLGLVGEASAVHALTVGAIGSMTVAVMTRASLGHTGRALTASPPVVGVYVLISLSALTRIAVPIWLPQYYNHGMVGAGVMWMIAFAVLSAVYWPVLTRPRISARAAEGG